MPYTETLTVRIQGDSSGLSETLSSVATDIGNLQQQITSAANSSQQISQGLSRVSAAQGPLQQISTLLQQVTQRAQTLSNTSISLNVAPALRGLQQLLAAAQAVAAALAAISSTQINVGPRGGPRGPQNPRMPGFATGGLVTGPTGIDRVPAMLTTGEFVLNREATGRLGHSLLHSLNAGQMPAATTATRSTKPTPVQLDFLNSAHPSRPRDPQSTPSAPPASARDRATSTPDSAPVTTNHFGGITIQVQEPGDINSLVRDLRLQGLSLRNRRG